MKLIVGLGNPGKEYEYTRHNIGFVVIDHYLTNATWQKKFKSLYTIITIDNEKVILLKPETFMNLSGEAVSECANFFKIDAKDILVIHDDLDLPFGKYRLKFNSSAGGHNGIKSIINCIGTDAFARLKIGISKDNLIDTKDFVLGHLKKEQLEQLDKLYDTFNNIINDFIRNDIYYVMNKYNGVK